MTLRTEQKPTAHGQPARTSRRRSGEHRSLRVTLLGSAAMVLMLAQPATARTGPDGHDPQDHGGPRLLVTGLAGGSGSTVGPDGALYVPEPISGTITRVDPRTGRTSTFADGLPPITPGFGTGGVMDVAFLGHTVYALVTLVGPDVGGTSVVGLYRVEGRHQSSVVADIGAWSIAHPPVPPFFVPSGVQYALQAWHGGFLVTDGHHNRVLEVSTSGAIRKLVAFGNVVPTGLDLRASGESRGHDVGGRILLAEAGHVPHDPADGKIVSISPRSSTTHEVAAGASILTDVEVCARDDGIYAISNGTYSGDPEGSPGLPDTGSLVKVNRDGGFDIVAAELDRPTSLELIDGKAYVVTYDGEIWVVPFGHGCGH
jgi:hypothetical protein